MSFPNTIQGSYAAPYETGSVALYPIGQRMECPNGRIYRYAKMGASAAGIANKLYQSEVPEAEWDTLVTTTGITAASSTSVSYTNGATAVTLNELQYGYVILEETTYLGEVHRIAGNLEANAAATGTVYLFPGDVFQTTVGAGDVVTLVKNPFMDIIIKPITKQSAMCVGVPPVIIAAGAYGWVQTHGVASCLCEGTMIIGQDARPSNESDANGGIGALTAMDYDEGTSLEDMGAVARVVEVAPTTTFCTVFLTLEGLA